MKILSALPALALLLCLASCGPSDSRAATLRLKAKPGDSYVLQYKTDTVLDRAASAEGPATTENSTLLLVRRYTCTGEKGTSTKWTVKTESAKASGEGGLAMQAETGAASELRKKPTDVERDERNLVVGEAKSSPIEFEFPIEEVRVGDAWRSEARLFGIKLSMIYEVAGFEKVDGKDAVKISGRIEDARGVSLSQPLETWYELQTGWPIKGSCELKLDQGNDAVIRVKLTMSRVS